MKIFEEVKKTRQEERKCNYKILKYLQTISDKKLYCDLGYSNLFKYLVKELRYSESEAYIRISALRLMSKAPVVEKKIQSGEMSLTKAKKLSTFMQEEKLNKNETEELVLELDQKSTRETELELWKRSSNPKKREKSILLSEKLMTKIDRYRAQYGDLSEVEIFEILLDEKLKKPEAPRRKSKKRQENTRYLSRATRYQVYQKAQGQCQHPSCDEKRDLEYDHVKPYSYGGGSSLENLQLLCSNHNKRRWIKAR